MELILIILALLILFGGFAVNHLFWLLLVILLFVYLFRGSNRTLL